VQPKVQLRAGESEWVKPAPAMKPQVALRMPRASAWWIGRGHGYIVSGVRSGRFIQERL
jgi:hypothetical protein